MSANPIPSSTPAIRVHQFGGPEVLRYESIPLAAPGAGEVLLKQGAVGVNFIDTYHRSGLYPLSLPAAIGTEAAGEVVAVGAGVTHLAPGARVAYVALPPGSYADYRVLPAERLVGLPDEVSLETGAASLLKGLTAWYLLRRSYRVQAGDPILVYAAAGATGAIVCQWARSLKARVIGVVGTPAKAERARQNGCDETVLAADGDFVKRVKELSGGGVAVVYDSVGRDTFFQSLDCLRKHGTMVTFGNASGPVDPFSPAELAKRGSLHLTRPSLFDFIAARADLEAGADELYGVMKSGAVRIPVERRYPLKDAGEAHRDLEGRKTTGASVLIPGTA